MKIAIFALLLLSSQAFACPDLTGSYLCKAGSRTANKEIHSTNQGYIINSDGNELEYFTDGRVVEVPETDSFKDGKYTSVCNGDQFVVTFTATLMYEGSPIAKQVSRSTYSKNGDNLKLEIKTKSKNIPLPTINFNCTPVQAL
jgi:hypothetical protein